MYSRSTSFVFGLTCVPGVVAGGPGQIPGEGVGQEEDGPG